MTNSHDTVLMQIEKTGHILFYTYKRRFKVSMNMPFRARAFSLIRMELALVALIALTSLVKGETFDASGENQEKLLQEKVAEDVAASPTTGSNLDLVAPDKDDNSERVCGPPNATSSYREDSDHSLVPEDLLYVEISPKAYIPFANYTNLGVPQLYDPNMVNDSDEIVSLTGFVTELNISEKFVAWARSVDEYDGVSDDCVLRDERCMIWAFAGFCHGSGFNDDDDDHEMEDLLPFATPASVQHYMSRNCCPACDQDTADHLEFLSRCPHNPQSPDTFVQPGDVNKFFLGLLDNVKHLSPTIHAAPISLDESLGWNGGYKHQPGGPWVVTFDDFVNEIEIAALQKWAARHGYVRSGDDGEDVVSWRTSSEAWCEEPCLADPDVDTLWDRVENVTGLSRINSDYLQLLKYTEGQFYEEHQDYHPHQAFSTTGARVVTFYMYLNGEDDVRNGGGTNFPHLNVTIYPKQGRALVWSNVRDDSVNEESFFARHQALPVQGASTLKYSATAWFHQREFQTTPYECRY